MNAINTSELTAESLAALNKTELLTAAQALLVAATARRASSGPSRKTDVLNQLRQNSPLSILDIANNLSTPDHPITSKNISSQLTYLRKDGYIIHRDHLGRVYLTDPNQTLPEPSEPATVNPE